MSFAAAFSAATGVAGLIGARRQARAEAERFNYQAELSEQAQAAASRSAAVINQLGSQTFELQQDQNDYFRDIYSDQSRQQAELQEYLRRGDTENARRVEEEIAQSRRRQVTADAAARETRAYELQRIADDDRTSAQEREYALAELDRERQIARQERATELDRVSGAEQTASSEYDDRRQRLEDDRNQRSRERDREVGIQNEVLSGARTFRDNMRYLQDSFGTISQPELFGADEIDRRAGVNQEALMKIVQRTIDERMSAKEADLIRTGVDVGGSSNKQRQEIMSRLVPDIQAAIINSQASAASEVEARNKTITDRFGALRAAQQANIDNLAQTGTAGLDIINGVRQTPSAVYDQNVGSAIDPNNVRLQSSEQGVTGPIGINSNVRSVATPVASIADYIRPQQLATSYSAAPSYVSAPQQQGYNFESFFNNGNSALNSNAQIAAGREDALYGRAANSAANYGATITDFLTEAGGENGFINDLFGGFGFGGSSSKDLGDKVSGDFAKSYQTYSI